MSQVDYFLKIDGIEGESQDDKHKNEIDVQSWGWGQTNQGDAAMRGGAGTGRVVAQDVHFSSTICKASPKLMHACSSGKHIASATLTCRRAGGSAQEYLKLKFTDLIVSHYSIGGGGDSVLPVDSYSFNFAKLEYDYSPQEKGGTPGGPVKVEFDYKKNKG